VVIAILIVVGVVVVKMHKATAVACALTSHGLDRAIEQSRFHNTGADVIASVAIQASCEPLANALVNRSAEPVEFELTDAATSDAEYQVPATELLEPAKRDTGTGGEADRIVYCFISYRESDWLKELCYDGVIEPVKS
jgi:hypothetical protein